MKALNELIRKNIQAMQPYSSARDEFQGEATVFLDANENPYNHPYNRYPDPLQWELKKMIATYKSVNVESIFLGNGSDEPIDLVIRVFCEPTADNIVSIAPSYGMYEVAAHVNNVEFRKVQLDTNFDVDVDALLQAVNARTKVIFLCSPNNPTGNNLSRERIHRILESFEGIVVVDEAYIDFADTPSFLAELGKFPNLIVLQTFSKAWGAAGVRLGMAFASSEIVKVLNKVKYPYNINLLTQQYALDLLGRIGEITDEVAQIIACRHVLADELKQLRCVQRVYRSDANFLLVRVGDADRLYDYLLARGIVVRNRNRVPGCSGCLRLTVGTPEENELLIKTLKEYDNDSMQ